jgi:hypothetical protein
MRRPRITLIPIKGGYKWRVRRYTGNPVYDNFEGVLEYPTAVLALEGCAKYMAMWEDVWSRQKVSPMKGILKVDIDNFPKPARRKHPIFCGCIGCIRKVGGKVSRHDME